MVANGDYGTGYAPQGVFHFAAIIICKRSPGAGRKIPTWQEFSADAQEVCVAKCLEGGKEKFVLTGWHLSHIWQFTKIGHVGINSLSSH